MKAFSLIVSLLALFSLFFTFISCTQSPPGNLIDEAKLQELIKYFTDTSVNIFTNRQEYIKKCDELVKMYNANPQEIAKSAGIKDFLTQKNTNFPLGLALMTVGVFLAFFGRRMFRIFLSASGLIIGASSLLYLTVWIEKSFNTTAPTWVFWTAGIIGGIFGSFLFLRAWKYAAYVMGAYGGFMLSFWIFSILPNDYRDLINVTAVNVVFAILGLICARFLERIVLIASSALMGAFVIFFGIDCLHSCGFRNHVQANIISSSTPDIAKIFTDISAGDNVRICMGGVFVITVAGFYVQFRNLKSLQSTELE